MAESKQGHKYGPVLSPMEEDFHSGTEHEATGGGIYNGMPGYPKGTPTKAPELTFDNSGEFGKVPKAGSKE